MATVDWMWFGNMAQVNATRGTPSTDAEADGTGGHNAVGQAQIKAVHLAGDTRSITVNGQPTEAFATSYNRDGYGRDVPDSRMTYQSPHSGQTVTTTITGFLSVRYQLTFPNGDTSEQGGVLIQMENGDTFFRPSKDALPQWEGIDALRAVKILSADPLPANTYVATISFRPTIHDLPITCFASGTMIHTPMGDRRVEDLRIGDLVTTRDHGPQPVRWIGRRHVTAAEIAGRAALAPVRIAAGALGDGLPRHDLLVSQQHRVLVRSAIAARMFGARELLIPAKHLTEVDGIDIVADMPGVTYVHLMFSAHEIVLSNGSETESLYPGPQALVALGDMAGEILALFPQLRDGIDGFPAARPFVAGPKARQLALRHAVNNRPLASRSGKERPRPDPRPMP
ncbi:Hint domain-containing protein [Paracoccus sediminis]|uniref:Hint domain-containing protein n=1 Tax=Paracoccus sediminis TaxID=1214787 RepID=A0A238VY08_9RHOB|nr:Hint domain-containing protein [Paracoccus sediminis]TBN51337.1 Hint domain-containing protein [Paracoccus sediminis]SNR38359.1 Hint domain-containing protein [Paracoccus sediminis]